MAPQQKRLIWILIVIFFFFANLIVAAYMLMNSMNKPAPTPQSQPATQSLTQP